MARHAGAQQGTAWPLRQGTDSLARRGRAWRGAAVVAWPVAARRYMARLGMARPSGHSLARLSMARQVGMERLGYAGQVSAWLSSLGMARPGLARHGGAVMARIGQVCPGPSRRGSYGEARPCRARHGLARRSEAVPVRIARYGKAGHGRQIAV